MTAQPSERRETAGGSRVLELDALRGLALLGLAVVNFLYLAKDMSVDKSCDCNAVPVWAIQDALFHDKAYLVFSFLAGFALWRRRSNLTDYAARRGIVLALLGVVHQLFFSLYDVLIIEAMVVVVAVLVVFVCRLSDWWVVVVATGFLLLQELWYLYQLHLLPLFGSAQAGAPDGAQGGVGGDLRFEELVTSSPGDTAYAMQASFWPAWESTLIWRGPGMAAAALLGVVLARRALFARPWRRRWLAAGLAVTVPLAVLEAANYFVDPGWMWKVQAVLEPWTAVVAAATFIGVGFAVFHTRPQWGRVFLPAGQLSGTNYIVQSIMVMAIFSGYGLALAGHLTVWWVAALAIATWLTQLATSRWWLCRFRYGPIEWCLRYLFTTKSRTSPPARPDGPVATTAQAQPAKATQQRG
ncbi:DUF418 domain-containing protein [Flindersiella endophytica]